MTIFEAIAQADGIRDNEMPTYAKIGWLRNVDQTVYEELIRGREGDEDVEYPRYTENDGSKELLVPPPYDMLYVYRLEAEYCYSIGENKKQTNALIRYNELMSGFAAKYVAEHKKKETAKAVYF